MKVNKHIEKLLRQGRKSRELVELGFPKRVVTSVSRQLKKEKAALKAKTPEVMAQEEIQLTKPSEPPEKMAMVQQKTQSVERKPQEAESMVNSVPEVATLLVAALQFGDYRRETCRYQQDGLCTLWMWETEEVIPRGAGEPVYIEGADWHIKPSPFYCAFCSASLEDRLDDVEQNPLSASSKIICEHCSSKGWIAVKIICTKCRHETYLGWWPKKK